jgi:predicted HTH domain antitoxin
MSSKTISLTLPTALAQELQVASQVFLLDLLERGLQDYKIERALEQYRHGHLSFGAAAQQADVSEAKLAQMAYAKGIQPFFSSKTVAEELGGGYVNRA